METLNLISNLNRIETPFINVTIGKYVFGAWGRKETVKDDGVYTTRTYPNYVRSLDIEKINGQVNKYTLQLEYTIRDIDDPNFFEKVFSSVSKTRKILFSYGDMCMPNYCFRDEQAIITSVKNNFNINSNSITYTVKAVSSAKLLDIGVFPRFAGRKNTKPSDVIKELLTDVNYGLLDIFSGMRNGLKINGIDLIPGDDLEKDIEEKVNISVLDYLKYLVSLMTPVESSSVLINPYILIFGDDVSGELMGPYFKIIKTDNNIKDSEAYTIDIGFPGNTLVTDFRVENDEQYSIYFDYQQELYPEEYVSRLNNMGEYEDVYAPVISSGNEHFETKENDKNWLSKLTSFPIRCSITLKGLIKPVVLMSYVKLNVLFFGKKHIASGLYVVTKQEDTVSASGFRTTLNMLRVAGDDSFVSLSSPTYGNSSDYTIVDNLNTPQISEVRL